MSKNRIGALRPTAEIKSARVLDVAELGRHIEDAKRSGESLAIERELSVSDDGQVTGRKPWGGLARAMPPAFQHTAEQAQALAAERGVPWRDEYAGRLVNYWASDERVDGHGDIVRQDWNFGLFKDNPAMPFGHRWEEPTIGTHLDWRVLNREDEVYNGPALALLSLFATAEQSAFADSIFRLVSARMLKAGSVGFGPGRVVWVEDQDERAELGLGRHGYILEANTLLEFSPTTLGANPGAGVMSALAKAKRHGLVRAQEFQVLREFRRFEVAKSDARDSWGEEDQTLVRIGRLLFPAEKIEHHADIDAPIQLEDFADSISKSWHADALAMPATLLAGDIGGEAEVDESEPADSEIVPTDSGEPVADAESVDVQEASAVQEPSTEEKIAGLATQLCAAIERLDQASAAIEEFSLSIQRQIDELRDRVDDVASTLELAANIETSTSADTEDFSATGINQLAMYEALRSLPSAQ